MARREARRKPVEESVRRAVREIGQVAEVDLSWQAKAACRTVPVSTAAAMQEASTREHGEVLGWRCEACPVAWDCLSYGLETKASGLHGGFALRNGREVA